MDKKSFRLKGITYRSSLRDETVRAKSDSMCHHLKSLLTSLPEPYLTYTAMLPGELNPANAFMDRNVVFIQPYKSAPMDYLGFSTIIIPMVVADRHGNRIGMGGGWFDTFLETQPDATIIGCCYGAMVFDQVPSEPHDVRVDYIVTESSVISRHASLAVE